MKTKIKRIIPIVLLWLIPIVAFATTPSITTAATKTTATSSANQDNRNAAQQSVLEKFSTDFFLNLFLGIVVLVITVIIAKIARNKLVDVFEKKLGGDMSGDIAGVVFRTVNIIIWTIGFTTALALWGVDLAFLMGGVGIGLGFTMQVFLGNFIGGLIIIFSGEYQTGKLIEVTGQLGTIKRITSMFTTIEKFDGTCYNVPNVKFLQDEVLVYNMNSKRRLEVNLGIDYNNDIMQAKEIAMKVMENFPSVLHNPGARVLVDSLGNDGVNLKLQFWVSSDEQLLQLRSNITETLNLAYNKAGIKLSRNILLLGEVSTEEEKINFNKK